MGIFATGFINGVIEAAFEVFDFFGHFVGVFIFGAFKLHVELAQSVFELAINNF